MDYWGGTYVSVCKAWGKLEGSGGMLPPPPPPLSPGEILFFWNFYFLEFGGIWDFFLHKHNSPFIVIKAFINA